MTRTCRPTPLAVLLLLAAPAAGQGFVPVDDFEGLPPGPVAGLAGWSDAAGLGTVDSDPDDPANRALRVDGTGADADFFKTLPFDVEEGAVGTLFLRVRPGAGDNHGVGLSDRADPAGSWSSFEAQVQWVDPDVLVRDGPSAPPVGTYAPDTWYRVWFVVDNASDTYDVHVSTTSAAGAPVADDFSFRNGPAANPLESFFARVDAQAGGASLWIDDVWLDPTGANLTDPTGTPPDPVLARVAEANARSRRSNEGFVRARDYYQGWMTLVTGAAQLIPQSANNDGWIPENTAADNYGFLVLSAALTDPAALATDMTDMLASEIANTSRSLGAGKPAVLPDDFDLSDDDFRNPTPDLFRQTQGSSEYVKDGLTPVTEWLGTANPWFARLVQLTDHLWENEASLLSDQGAWLIDPHPVFGDLVVYEKHGEALQVLPRLFWQSGDPRYRDWATRTGDHYLLDGPVYPTSMHPTYGTQTTTISLQDHGNEIVSGLVELYAMLRALEDQGDPAAAVRVAWYRQPLYDMLDFVLQFGRNADGLFYREVATESSATPGAVVDGSLVDTFGYVYYAFYTAWLVDRDTTDPVLAAKVAGYRDEVRRALENLRPLYLGYPFSGGPTSDVLADSIEGTLNLFSREPDLAGVADWMDQEIDRMWALQTPSGWINAGYSDGNWARTTMMYALWKSQGVRTPDWRDDLYFGAVTDGLDLVLLVEADADWTGALVFDTARHADVLGMPLDTTRINQFPEWFTVDPARTYRVWDWEAGTSTDHGGATLAAGLTVSVTGGDELVLFVEDLGPFPPTVYCTAKTSSAGCVAAIAASAPSPPVSGAGDFAVLASGVQELKNGLLFAGIAGPAALPFNGGTLCVQPPTKRGPVTSSGGADPLGCAGAFTTLVNDGLVVPFGLDAGSGNTAWYQYWYRDPANGPGQLGTALSDAVRVDFL